MKPAPFQYECPRGEAELAEILASRGSEAKVLAGGQSLLQLMNMRVLKPKLVVDINRIESFHYIREEETSIAVGPLIRHRDLVKSDLVRTKCPMLSKAVRFIGHQAIRNRGTALGSLAHADPGAELPTVMTALGGELTAAGLNERMEIVASRFFQGVNQTSLLPTQYLQEARFPKIRAGEGHAFHEFSMRYNDPAIVTSAVSIFTDEFGVVTRIRGALGGVGSTPVYFEPEAASLVGAIADEKAAADAAERVASGLEPPDHLFSSAAYRKELAVHLLKKGIMEAYTEAVRKEM
ncbi:FAD binding domain-containing protein [Paenibacillus beijingensis]|uniref:FAD-binding PCMH-type domain-containing protein n=1 Tax=Paenibacillus beijingensis TaxID=1126833 RepID=A0A0D5NF02_9BACL|nr:FAD binding domain-containing protein [Paenibacillus beijingensis]AJY73498.1 hypothetical protein VN24_01240 [Paenibacillus beijingensis]